MQAIPITLAEANDFVSSMHRHHPPVYRDKYRIGCIDNGRIVGVVQIGRPVSRVMDDGKTLEVVRLCTDGTKNACSYLYGAASRVARELGYSKIITYILEGESGASLRAAGWKFEGMTKGGSWNCQSRPRSDNAPTCPKQRWSKVFARRS